MPPIVTSRFGEIAAGALRLAHRALQTHAHDLDYEPAVGVEQALEHARAQRGGRSARAITNQILGFRAERVRRLDGEVRG